MAGLIGIGAGAGLVSSLLFSVVITGNPLALILYLAAPLPILIVALGWNHRVGLVAALVSSALVGVAFALVVGLVFAATVALPGWWFAYLLLLARSDSGTVEWYPLGRLLQWVALVSAAVTALGVVVAGQTYEGWVDAFVEVPKIIAEINPNAFEGVDPAAQAKMSRDVAALFATLAPPLAAAATTATFVLLIWVAAKAVLASGRLPRPWPQIAAAELPQTALAVLAAALALAVVVPGLPRLAGLAFAGAVVMAYCLQGLAVIHVLTRGVGGRIGILAAVYLVFFILPGWPQLLYAAVGVADSFFGMRARKTRAQAGPPTTT